MSIKQPGITHPFRRSLYVQDLLLKDLAIVRDFYQDHGYLGFAIANYEETFNDAKRTVRLVVHVIEGPITYVSDLSFDGVTVFTPEEVRDVVKLRAGGVYSPFVSNGDVERLTRAYVDRGYFFARVSKSESKSANGIGVAFHVREGSIATLRAAEVTGNTNTRSVYIERELELERGGEVTGRQLREGQRRLTKFGLFSLVRPRTLVVDSSRALVDVIVDVRERKQGWYGLGFGFTSDERVRVSGEWGHRNVAGTTRRVQLTGSIGWDVDSLFTRGADKDQSERTGQLTWVEPWVFGARVEGSFAVFHVLDQKPRAFRYETNGLRAAFKREVSEFTDLFLTLENEWVQSNDTTLVSSDYVRQNVGFGGERDRRDDLLDPRRGSVQRGNFQYSRLEGDYTYAKSLVSTSHAWSKGTARRTTVAVRGEVGYTHAFVGSRGRAIEDDPLAEVPYQDRFFVGGATTLRGYRRDEVGPLGTDGLTRGGTVLLLANAEFRFPIFWRFHGGLFVDAGNIWAHPADVKGKRLWGSFGKDFSSLDLRYAIGAGLRAQTPVGPLRLDYGRKIGTGVGSAYQRAWDIHVSLGHAF
jgi:outer membrane protein insertion porin family